MSRYEKWGGGGEGGGKQDRGQTEDNEISKYSDKKNGAGGGGKGGGLDFRWETKLL